MCRKTQDSSKQSLLERFWNQRRLCSRNTTTTSLPNEQTPSLAFSSSSTLQGTVDVCLLLARLSSTGGSSLSATVDSGTPDSNREEYESLAIERVVEQWLGSVRQRWHQNWRSPLVCWWGNRSRLCYLAIQKCSSKQCQRFVRYNVEHLEKDESTNSVFLRLFE